MMKLMLMPAAALFLLAANPAAEAAPVPAYTPAVSAGAAAAVAHPSGQARLLLVREGCGRGFHRNRWGDCRMNRRLRREYRREWRHHHARRRCFVRDTPFGYRRICRW